MKIALSLLAPALGAILIFGERTADAQVPSAVYDDVKTVIEDLIEKDVAQTVVPNISCQAPVTLRYFPNTLQRVYDRQFGQLQSAIQTDSAELAGSLVYYALTTNNADPASLIESFFDAAVGGTCVAGDGTCLTANEDIVLKGADKDKITKGSLFPIHYLPNVESPACASLVQQASGPLPFANALQGLLDGSCTGNVTLPCDLGRATKELVAGDTVTAEGDLQLAIAAVLGTSLTAPAITPPVTNAVVKSIASLVQRYFAAFATNPSVDPETYITLDPTLPSGPGGVDTDAFKARLRRSAREWTLATGASKQGMTLSNFTRYLLEGADAAALCPRNAAGQPPAACGKLGQLVGTAAADVRRIVQAASSHDVAAVAMDVLRAIFTIGNALDGDNCSPHPAGHISTSATRFNLRTQLNVKAPAKAQSAAADVAAGAAGAAPPAGAPKAAAESPDCDRQVIIQRYGQFLASLVAYSVEVATTGKSTSQTQGAFESAVFDVLQTDGPNAGTNRDFGTNFLLPKPSLRLSWNAGYVNDVASNGFRYVAVLDWPTVRFPFRNTQGVYFALDVSLVDLLGPFSESALRKQSTNYDSGALEWAEFLDPRVEVMFGIPSLTTHLVLTGGLSYRSAGVATNHAGTLKYYSPYAARPSDYPGDDVSYFSQFIEVGLGVKYLP